VELLRGVAATLRLPGPDEDLVAFTEPPHVTVTRDSDGKAILDEAAGEVAEGEDVYFTAAIDGFELPDVDLLTAVWTGEGSTYTTHAEVVGGFATSLKAIRAKLDPAPAEEVTDADLAAKREIALRSIEEACGVAFRARYHRDVLDGTGSRELLLSRPRVLRILAASVDGEAAALDELTVDPAGILLATAGRWSCGRANVEAAYAHGYESLRSAELPVRDLAAYLLTLSPTDWNERATGMSNEMGSYSLVTPGVRDAIFPLPSVNSFVREHRVVTVA
jgi:hypothetical protein